MSPLRLIFVLLLGGCVRHVAVEALPCPCSDGWICCDNPNICVRDGEDCPAPEPPDLAPAGDRSPSGFTTLSLVAGELGGSGNLDSLGNQARFWDPEGVAFDGAGHLYVSDTFNHTVRRVVLATGEVTTPLGAAGQKGSTDGQGALVRFDEPRGLAADGAGRLYVADSQNHTIRQVDLATYQVSTLAGVAGQPGAQLASYGGGDRFNGPQGLALDGAGHLYVADTGNHVIVEITLPDGRSRPIAGSPDSAASVDGTGTGALFISPTALVADGSGNLYVADSAAGRIRKIVIATGVVTTILDNVKAAGGDTFQPNGLQLDGDQLYISDGWQMVIGRLTLSSGDYTQLAGSPRQVGAADGIGSSARLSRPMGMALDGVGRLFFADNNSCIRALVLSTSEVTTFAGSPSHDGSDDGVGTAARFSSPNGMWSDGGDAVYLCDWNGAIRKIAIAGAEVTTVAQFAGCEALSGDGAGHLYVNDGNFGVDEIDLASGSSRQIGTADWDAWGVAWAGGDVYIALIDATIRKISLATGANTIIAGAHMQYGSADGQGSDARFGGLHQMAAKDGALYIVDGNTIRKLTLSTNVVTTLAGTPGLPGDADGIGADARFDGAWFVAVDDRNLYIGDQANHTIRKLALDSGRVTTLAGVPGKAGVRPGPLPASLSYPDGVAVVAGGVAISDERSVLLIH